MNPYGFTIPNICTDIPGGGMGGEAVVSVQLRNVFPGIGGLIKTVKPDFVAVRQEIATASGTGNETSLRHYLFKKLDDYFRHPSQSAYLAPHIPRLFGSISQENEIVGSISERIDSDRTIKEASLYEWAWGQDGFSWIWNDGNGEVAVVLDEQKEFNAAFLGAGINMSYDTVDGESGGKCSKNIICKLPMPGVPETMNMCWCRIDFGSGSVMVDREQLKRFLYNRSASLEKCLGIYRYELLQLAYKRLYERTSLTEREMGFMDILFREYRKSTLRHLEPYIVS